MNSLTLEQWWNNGISRNSKTNKKPYVETEGGQVCVTVLGGVYLRRTHVHCSYDSCVCVCTAVEYGRDTSCTNFKMDVYSRTRMINVAAAAKWEKKKRRRHNIVQTGRGGKTTWAYPERHKNRRRTNIFFDIIKVFHRVIKTFPSPGPRAVFTKITFFFAVPPI